MGRKEQQASGAWVVTIGDFGGLALPEEIVRSVSPGKNEEMILYLVPMEQCWSLICRDAYESLGLLTCKPENLEMIPGLQDWLETAAPDSGIRVSDDRGRCTPILCCRLDPDTGVLQLPPPFLQAVEKEPWRISGALTCWELLPERVWEEECYSLSSSTAAILSKDGKISLPEPS